MKWRCSLIRPRIAAHVPTDRVRKVSTDSPWIQLKWPGLSSVMKKELSTVQYMATTHTLPIRRWARSPRVRRSSCHPPKVSASEAPRAWTATRSLITLL